MADASHAEKTEQATPKREREFREKGQIAFSRDAAAVAGLLGAWVVGSLTLPGVFSGLEDGFRAWIGRIADPGAALADPRVLFVEASSAVVSGAGGLVLATGFAGGAISLAQTRGNFSGKAVAPDWNRVDPVAGFGRLLSLRALVEALKGLFKAVLLGVAAGLALSPFVGDLPRMMSQPLESSLAVAGEAVSRMVKVACVLLGVLAAADYLFQRWSNQKQMRMTRQEQLEELKQDDGNPQIKGRRRQVHRSLASGNRLVAAIAEADVIVTNPDHFAIALAYVMGRHRAPVITAMGVDARAEQIKRLAREKGIPRVENRPLARLLWKTGREGREIPEDLYQAVAEVMAFVQRVRGLRGDRTLGATR